MRCHHEALVSFPHIPDVLNDKHQADKVKVTAEQATEIQRGSRGIALLFL